MVPEENNHVRAAGGVVWRRAGEDGAVHVLVVHRPRYDDWSLPKGKADPGESDADCARREVEEETGLTCRLGTELPSTSYRDNKGRPKTVRYWAMEPLTGEAAFTPNAEIDEIRWLPVVDAVKLLSYEHDRPVVQAFEPPA
ncbi:MAG TPA: NUDIX hydrolase [Acidimicrobiia bacterium]|nr:NUDIX hydrolase [Acidimicrobiia bacterium]